MYFKQLDSLRAIAVTMVLCFHWLPSLNLLQKFNVGPYGVMIFFVLSGFLITRILIENKLKIEQKKGTIKKALKRFYFRRILRIFPIYYLLLVFLFLIGFENIRNEIWWHFLYLSNVLFAINNEFSSGLSHLWSLSVEEQFYIIWPTLIFFIPLKRLKPFLILSIVIGILTNFLLTNFLTNGSLLVFARIDAFAWGGLISYMFIFDPNWYVKIQKFKITFFILLIGFIILHFTDLNYKGYILNLIFLILCFFLISKFVVGFKGRVSSIIFENRVLIYLGKISYGIYLYHNFMQWLIPYYSSKLNIPFPEQQNEFARFFIYLTITIIVSMLSFEIIEKRFNKLKK